MNYFYAERITDTTTYLYLRTPNCKGVIVATFEPSAELTADKVEELAHKTAEALNTPEVAEVDRSHRMIVGK